VSKSIWFEDFVHLDTLETNSTTITMDEGFYYWRVWAFDEAGNSSYPSVDSFGMDISAPLAPVLVGPSAGDTLALSSQDSVSLIWMSSEDGWSGIESYEVCYMDSLAHVQAPDTVFTFLPYPVTYFAWKVRAYDCAGNPGPWSEEWSVGIVDVDEDEVSLPQSPEFALFSCWPNPSRGEVHLRYQAPEGSRVMLQVFDASGRLVRSLADGKGSGIEQRVVWNGADGMGIRASAGIYYAILKAGGRMESRKILLLE
jgi:hypothetical protein